MSQTRLYISTDEPTAEYLLEILEQNFEEDGYAIATHETEPVSKIWHLSVYVMNEEAEHAAERFQAIIFEHQIEEPIQREALPDIDWVAKSLEGLKPVQVGRFFIHGAHDADQVKPSQVPIQIDAAQAFGTGHHGTTAGCLEMIIRLSNRSHHGLRAFEPILDLGTGSGVLAFAAAKLSHANILATDIDPVATQTARENARVNQVTNLTQFKTINGMTSPIFGKAGPFGLIIANILAKPLMKMAPSIAQHTRPGGFLILSGILVAQRWKVLSAFKAQGVYHDQTIWRDGWVTMILQNRALRN